MRFIRLRREGATAVKFAAVGCLGFLTDIGVLRLCLRVLHLSPFEGRAVSLACALQVTFLINGLVVFRCLSLQSWGRQWLAYMATNGLGNLINYLVFAGLVASRLPIISRNGWALVTGSIIAYVFNFLCARFMVFGAGQERFAAAASPSGGSSPDRPPSDSSVSDRSAADSGDEPPQKQPPEGRPPMCDAAE